MITYKLVNARRAALILGAHRPASLYVTTIGIVVESAIIWVLAIILHVIASVTGGGRSRLAAFSPLLNNIFLSVAVRYQFLVMLLVNDH
jgi:hypothetical protein